MSHQHRPLVATQHLRLLIIACSPALLDLYEDYEMKLFRRMASTLPMQIGSQTNGTRGNYLISKQLHRNIWRAV